MRDLEERPEVRPRELKAKQDAEKKTVHSKNAEAAECAGVLERDRRSRRRSWRAQRSGEGAAQARACAGEAVRSIADA